MEEIVKVISIDTRKSERSIKDLKNDIKALKRELENTTIGSKEFDLKLTQLGNLQKEYKAINEEIVNSSKPVKQQMFELARFGENLAKSYSAINAAMGLLSGGNEDVQAALAKTARWIQLIQGLSGFAPLIKQIPALIGRFKELFKWLNPVNDRINNLATKIAGLDVSKLNALNGGSGGSASAAASATGNVPAATASQKGFSAAIIQTNNDLLEQKKKLVEIEEQMSEQVAIIEEVENKYNATGDALRKLMPDIAMYTDNMNELVHIDQKLLDAYNGKIHLSKQEIDELIKKGTAIRQWRDEVDRLAEAENA